MFVCPKLDLSTIDKMVRFPENHNWCMTKQVGFVIDRRNWNVIFRNDVNLFSGICTLICVLCVAD